ncbi:hypothetical protein [Methylobacterium fujisawaense]
MSTEATDPEDRTEAGARRKVWTRDERATISGIKARAIELLSEAGVTAHRVNFPFAIHHRVVVRSIRRGFEGRAHLRASEVSDLLESWSRENGGAEIYAWQAVALSSDALAAKNGIALPDEVDTAIDGLLVDRGLGFVRHVRRMLAA